MKKKLTLFCITIIAVLSVGVKYSENNKELPPVLFSYLYKNTRYCSVWTIDNEGISTVFMTIMGNIWT